MQALTVVSAKRPSRWLSSVYPPIGAKGESVRPALSDRGGVQITAWVTVDPTGIGRGRVSRQR